MHMSFAACPWLGWPTDLVCPGQRDFLGHTAFSTKMGISPKQTRTASHPALDSATPYLTWASYLTSLYLSLLIYKMGIMMVTRSVRKTWIIGSLCVSYFYWFSYHCHGYQFKNVEAVWTLWLKAQSLQMDREGALLLLPELLTLWSWAVSPSSLPLPSNGANDAGEVRR